jgi:SAM-dependent methyltransferase
MMTNDMHEANRQHWNAAAGWWRKLRDRDGLWRRCPQEPALAFDGSALETIQDALGDLAGKAVCVIGSGDNYAAFALAGLGAAVTSVDISEEQLKVGADRARELGLEINFVRADATALEPLGDATFDLVCSSNGFFVWISEPAKVFAQVHRVLRPGGWYVFYDTHPFQRPWKDQVEPIEMEKAYWDTGPFEEENDDVTYEFNWTMADMLNPLAASGLVLRRVIESPAKARFWQDHSYLADGDDSLLDWRNNPRAGLPAWLTVAAQRP